MTETCDLKPEVKLVENDKGVKMGRFSMFKSMVKKQLSSFSGFGSVFSGVPQKGVEPSVCLDFELTYDLFDFVCERFSENAIESGSAKFSNFSTETRSTSPLENEEVTADENSPEHTNDAKSKCKPELSIKTDSGIGNKPSRFLLSKRILKKILRVTNALNATNNDATTNDATNNNATDSIKFLSPEVWPAEEIQKFGPEKKSVKSLGSRFRRMFTRTAKAKVPEIPDYELNYEMSNFACSIGSSRESVLSFVEEPKRLLLTRFKSVFAKKIAPEEGNKSSENNTAVNVEAESATNNDRKPFVYSGIELDGDFTYRAARWLTRLWPEMKEFDVSYLSKPEPAPEPPTRRQVHFYPGNDPILQCVAVVEEIIRRSPSTDSVESHKSHKLLKSCLKRSESDFLVTSVEESDNEELTSKQLSEEFRLLKKMISRIEPRDSEDYFYLVYNAALQFRSVFEKFTDKVNHPVYEDFVRYLKKYNDVKVSLTCSLNNALARSLKYQLAIESVVDGADNYEILRELEQQMDDIVASERDLDDINKSLFGLKSFIEGDLKLLKHDASNNLYKYDALMKLYYKFFTNHYRTIFPREDDERLHEAILLNKYDLSCDLQISINAGKHEPQMGRFIELMQLAKRLLRDFNDQLGEDLMGLVKEVRSRK